MTKCEKTLDHFKRLRSVPEKNGHEGSHNDLLPGRQMCVLCTRWFSSPKALYGHLRLHPKQKERKENRGLAIRRKRRRVTKEEEETIMAAETLMSMHVLKSSSKKIYRCVECNKSFNTYQALGGHKASHKKIKNNLSEAKTALQGAAKVEHKCQYCGEEFESGQALGGHMRAHANGPPLAVSSPGSNNNAAAYSFDLNEIPR